MITQEFLEYFSRKIIKIAIPVIITLVSDAILTRFLEQNAGAADLDRQFLNILSNNNAGVSAGESVKTAIAIVITIVINTAILVGLYYFGCIKIIIMWMALATTLLLSVYMLASFANLPYILNMPTDQPSLYIFLANISIVGVMSIFWRAPKVVTQLFLILISILVSVTFLSLPDWTIWSLLILLIFYDAIVVLCPNGLLKLLIDKSRERGDAIPALIYASSAFFLGAKSDGEPLLAGGRRQDYSEEEEDEKESDEGIKLGLGDFVFFGILVTRAARLGWDLAILDILAVAIGLSITLLILAATKKPLPALPFSLFIGMVFFIVAATVFRKYWTNLRASNAVF